MNTLADRVKQERAALGLTQEQLGKIVGVGKASVSQWESGYVKTIEGNTLMKLAETFSVNPNWLINGLGKRDDVLKIENYDRNNALNLHSSVPIIAWELVATRREIIKNKDDLMKIDLIPCPIEHGAHTYALMIKNDAMASIIPGERSYAQGEIIYIDPEKEIISGCRVIALSQDGMGVFRQYIVDGDDKLLIPINPKYPTKEVNGFKIDGVIIGKFTPE